MAERGLAGLGAVSARQSDAVPDRGHPGLGYVAGCVPGAPRFTRPAGGGSIGSCLDRYRIALTAGAGVATPDRVCNAVCPGSRRIQRSAAPAQRFDATTTAPATTAGAAAHHPGV